MKNSIVSIEHIGETPQRHGVPTNPSDLPVLPTRDLVLFPGITIPITIGRESSLELVKRAMEKNVQIGVVTQRNPAQEYPTIPDDVFAYGVVADVLKLVELPDDTVAALVQAQSRMKITGPGKGRVLPGCASVSFNYLRDKEFTPETETMDVINMLRTKTLECVEAGGDMVPPDLKLNIVNIEDPTMLVNFIATRLPIESAAKIEILAEDGINTRAIKLINELNLLFEKARIMEDIRNQTTKSMNEQQRQMFMQQQVEILQNEINGGEDPDIVGLQQRFDKFKAPSEKLKATFNREIKRLQRLDQRSPDYSVLYTYLDTLLDLPWEKTTELNRDFNSAEQILNETHSGLEKVKDRILEQIAVTISSSTSRSPIICLVGAPGVGKTSLGASIAKALNRNFTRISLGGLHDEAEIRGHRRTYIGAMPGRIIAGLQKVGSSNPLILLDEIDKISRDFRGDPQAALLEVLDPEQNKYFHDNYIDVDFDLSNVMFITTANSLSTISRPLLDRMEVIEISGYLLEEKIDIAVKHTIPRLVKELSMGKYRKKFTPEAIKKIIEEYTAESGVRQMENVIATVLRRLLLKHIRGEKTPVTIKPEHIEELLGTPRYNAERGEEITTPGVVTGLAWTEVGGKILFIETSLSPAKEPKLTLT
ncbi:MAG: LON peptidase substrate-binding domain-containing protein, partial [Muribaculaceae bacterium]|nr:LON peptidase substrate-binding domain-containing protein [Muribaculaceae bacterium]